MENTLGTSSSQLKCLHKSPAEGEVVRESECFLLAPLELHRRVFWLDSPLKASLTSCRRASWYISCCCGYRKKVLNVKSRSLGCLLVTTPQVQELTAWSRCPAVMAQSATASSGDCPDCPGDGGAQQLW